MKQQKILVVGASGMVGSQLVKLLTEQGHQVRAATHQKPKAPTAEGVEFVQMNVVSGEGIKDAFAGIDKLFLLSPPGYADQHKILSPLIQEAKRQGLKKVVLMTAMGANAVETSPFRQAEIELEKSGLAYNIIRPNWFMQNFNTFWLQGIRDQGKMALPGGKAGVSFIDARDISTVAARLLTTSEFDNQAFDLTGPEALTHAEVAGRLTKITGKRVGYDDIKPEVLKSGLLAAGLPADYVDFMILIFGFLREGYNARLTGNVEKILGRPATGFNAYAAAHKQNWL